MIVEWNGRTWDGSGGVWITAAPGLEDWQAADSMLDAARDGAAMRALRLNPKAFTVEMTIIADDADAMAAILDDVREATWPDVDRQALGAFQFTIDGQAPRIVFARCVAQQIPTDFTTTDRYVACECQFAFESPDPQAYTEATNVVLDPSDTEAVTGVIGSLEGRFSVVIAGPATNPQLASSLHSSAVIRYVGTIASGSNLVLRWSPGYLLAKVVADADLTDAATWGVGTNAYPNLDGGSSASSRPPQWFPISAGSQTITYTTTSGSGQCDLTYWVPVP